MDEGINSINHEKEDESSSEEEIDEIQKEEKQKRIRNDAIKTLIGTEIHRFGFGTLMALNALKSYLLSYLRHFQKEKTLNLQHGYFFGLIILVTMSIFNIFAPAIQKKLGLRLVMIFCSLIDVLSCFILYVSKNYFLDLFAYFLRSFAGSQGVLIGRNLMGYFYEIRGKLSGSLSLVGSLVSSGYNILAEKIIINPMSDEADVDGSFYTFDVSKKILNFILLTIFLIIFSTIISLILIVPYDKEIHGKGLFSRNNEFSKIKKVKIKNTVDIEDIDKAFKNDDNNGALFPSEDNEGTKNENINENIKENKILDDDDDKKEKEEKKKKRKGLTIAIIKKSLKSKRILKLFLMGLFSIPLMNFLVNMWRPIAIRKGIPTIYQQNLNTLRPYVACASTLVFSWLSDTIPFRYLYSVLAFISSFVGIFFCFTLKSPVLFMLILLLNTIASSGRMAITGPHYMKVFGLKHFIEIGGVIGLYRVFMSPICYVFMFLFDEKYAKIGTQEISDAPYFALFIVCGALNIISAVLSLSEPEEKFIEEQE